MASASPRSPVTSGSAPRGIEVSDGFWQDIYFGLPQEWDCIGTGSFGKVYKAMRREGGDYDAVKVIPTGDEQEEEALEAVRKEVAIMRRIACPYVVAYRGCWHAATELWIAMEYCAGGSVEQITHSTQRPLSEEAIAVVCRESLQGLHYLHQKCILHRDVKGGNILLTEQGHVKLADFGVSAELVNAMSQRNTFVGTPYWMAPEVIQEQQYDGRADIWSLGITALEMAELAPPHHNLHPMRALFQIPRGPPPTLKPGGPWTNTFKSFVAACLVKDPTQRPHARMLLDHAFLTQQRDPQCLLNAVAAGRAAREQLREAAEQRSRQVPDTEGEDPTDTADAGRGGQGATGDGESSASCGSFVDKGSSGSSGGASFVQRDDDDDDDDDDSRTFVEGSEPQTPAQAAAAVTPMTESGRRARKAGGAPLHRWPAELPFLQLDVLSVAGLLRPAAAPGGSAEALRRYVAPDSPPCHAQLTPCCGALLRELRHRRSELDDPGSAVLPDQQRAASTAAAEQLLRMLTLIAGA